jgi:hypothetical protein
MKHFAITISALCLFWGILHIPGIVYGTQNTPLHISYMTADEQSPINGALHILESRSLQAVRSATALYYGPIFAIVAVPAVAADFIVKLVYGMVSGAQSYKDLVVWNWGGILIWGRIIALVVGFLGLLAVYELFLTKTFNPSQKKWIAWAAATILGLNFLYFEYANFFRHWVFVMAILLWQLYILVRMIETDSKRKIYWISQAILTICSFGISYLGIIFEVIWIPILIKWIREKRWAYLKEFSLYVLSVVIGMTAIIWWYPLGFQKIFGLTGIISAPTAMSGRLNLTNTVVSSHSFGFYAQVIFNNNFLLIVAGLFLLGCLGRTKKIFNKYWFWVLFLPIALNYVIFSIPTHHESRYMLPTVVIGVVAVMALYSWAYEQYKEGQILFHLSGFLLCVSAILSCVQIIGWERMIMAGPPERREIIPQIISWQKADPSARILVFKDWPLGWVHTHEAYADYIKSTGKDTSDLWQYLLNAQPPKNIVPINVYYRPSNSTTTKADQTIFDHIVVFNFGHVDLQVWNGSPNDQFDLKPWTVWNYTAYQDTYTIIK